MSAVTAINWAPPAGLTVKYNAVEVLCPGGTCKQCLHVII